MQALKLLHPHPIRKIHSFCKSRLGFLNSRLGFTNLYCCSKTTQQDDDEIVTEITFILNQNDWVSRIQSFQNPHQKLNPDFVQSVLHQNQSCDPNKLLHFFNWSATEMGTSQNLKSFLILSLYFCNKNQLRNASGVLDKMIDTRKPISDVVDAVTSVGLSSVGFTQLIYSYKNKRMLDEAVSLLLSYKNADCFPNSVCLNSLMSDLLKNNKLDLFWKVYDKLVEANVTPDVYTYCNLINAYCISGKMEDAKRVFSEMEEKSCSPNLVTYNLLIGGLCRYGHVNEAIEYKKSMTEKGLIPDEYTYNILIDGLCKAKRSSDTKFAYSSPISGFIKEGDNESAFKLFNEMQQKNVQPNIVTYNTLINGLCKVGDVNRARDLFDELPEKGVMVNTLTYSTIIDGYCKSGNLFEAFRLLDEMAMNGIQANEFVYGSLVNGCCKEGDTERALLVVDRMLKSGFAFTPTFNTLIDWLCKLGKLNEVNAVVKNLPGFTDLFFNDATSSTLIHHYCKSGIIKEAEDVLIEMKSKKLTPTIEMYTSLLHSYIKLGGKSKIFEDLIESGTSKNEVTDRLLDILSDENNFMKSFELLNHLLVKKLCCRSIFDALLDMFCKKGKLSEALSSIDELKKRGVTVGFDTCKTLIFGLKNGGYDNEVAKVFEKMVKFGWIPGSMSVNELISQEETDVKEVNTSNEAAL